MLVIFYNKKHQHSEAEESKHNGGNGDGQIQGFFGPPL